MTKSVIGIERVTIPISGINLSDFTDFPIIIRVIILILFINIFGETWPRGSMQETQCHAQEIYVTEGLSFVMFPIVPIRDSGVDGFQKAP